MDPVSVRFARASLLWLTLGFALGALMLSDALAPGSWRAWFAPTHGHILFVGWFLQFAVGVAYWLLPRRRSTERPLGYHEGAAFLSFALLNSGLALRVVAEPVSRLGHGGVFPDYALVASSMLQLAAVFTMARQLWARVTPRQPPRSSRDGAT